MRESGATLFIRALVQFLVCFVTAIIILAQPQVALAGQAWDVVKYNASTGAVGNDTFASEASDPYQNSAGACDSYPTCFPMWNNSLMNAGNPGGSGSAGAGDFDLNGTTDLVYQNSVTGQVSVYFFQGSYAQSFENSAALPSPGTGWNVEAVGALDGGGSCGASIAGGYGYPDVVYFNPSTGARQVYFYAGAQGLTLLGTASISSSIPPAQHVVAIADINADGQPDLITQNSNTANVKVSYLCYASTGSFTITGVDYMNSTGPQGWVVLGALGCEWRRLPGPFYKNNSTGEVTVNYFHGATYLSWADVEQTNASKMLFVTQRVKSASQAPILLYIGSTVLYQGSDPNCAGVTVGGVSDHDYYAVERELDAMGLTYATATYDGDSNTVNINTMTQQQLNTYGLFIVPGGNNVCIVENWTKATRQMIQTAVLQYGVSYLGICAGAFVAGYHDPTLNLTGLPLNPNDDNSFDFYSLFYTDGRNPLANAMVELSLPNGSYFASPMDTFWFVGPQLFGLWQRGRLLPGRNSRGGRRSNLEQYLHRPLRSSLRGPL